jgi:hypothetical protein
MRLAFGAFVHDHGEIDAEAVFKVFERLAALDSTKSDNR